MKTILICPNQANGIPVLADSRPLVTLPFLGEHFICYWLQHLAGLRIKEVRLVVSDNAEAVQEITGNGSRWGLNVELCTAVRDLSPTEARKRYHPPEEQDWFPQDVFEADHLPGLKEHKLFGSYDAWFKALALWMPYICQSKRIGLKELQPGVWVGRRCKIAKTVKFHAPCWLGDNVQVGKDAVIGPFAFLEDRVVVDQSAEIINSWLGPDTYLGTLTRVADSLAWGSLLIQTKTGSHIIVPDAFLMSSLSDRRRVDTKPVPAKSSLPLPTTLARPFEAVISLAQKLQS